MPTHLFVAPSTHSFGEVVLGLRLARDLVRRGDVVVFVGPLANEVLFRNANVTFVAIDPLLPTLERALPLLIEEHRCASVVLVDLMVMVLALKSRRVDVAVLDALPVPVYAIDIWDLRRSALELDLGAGGLVLSDRVRTVVPRRLVPVPFAPIDAEGAYNALPVVSPLDRGDGPPRILFTTSRFQVNAATPAQKRVLEAVPRHVVEQCLATGDDTRVIHVGPEPVLGAPERYEFAPQMPEVEYLHTLGTSDLLVTMNQSATSITTALALGVPTLVATSDVARDTSTIVPFPFRVFPFGFVSFLSSLLDKNPYAQAVPTAEILPGHAFVEAARSMLFDAATRAHAREQIRDYTARVRVLPSVVECFDRLR